MLRIELEDEDFEVGTKSGYQSLLVSVPAALGCVITLLSFSVGFKNRSYTTTKSTNDGTGRLLGSKRSGESALIKIPHHGARHLTDCTYHMHNASENSYSIHKDAVSSVRCCVNTQSSSLKADFY